MPRALSIFSLYFPTPGILRTLSESKKAAVAAVAAAVVAPVASTIFWPFGLFMSDAILATMRLAPAPALQLSPVAEETAARISDTSAVTRSVAALAAAASAAAAATDGLVAPLVIGMVAVGECDIDNVAAAVAFLPEGVLSVFS